MKFECKRDMTLMINLNVFFGRWRFKKLAGLCEDFKIKQNIFDELTIKLAVYDIFDYKNKALVIFTREKNWYLVEAFKNSMNGIEGQWFPIYLNEEKLFYLFNKNNKGVIREEIARYFESVEKEKFEEAFDRVAKEYYGG